MTEKLTNKKKKKERIKRNLLIQVWKAIIDFFQSFYSPADSIFKIFKNKKTAEVIFKHPAEGHILSICDRKQLNWLLNERNCFKNTDERISWK